jgi:ferredoxin
MTIDDQRCTGHGRCYDVAPALVVDDERGYGVAIHAGEFPPELEYEARRAMKLCPEQAITIGT